MGKIRIKDIAQIANVSIGTVDRVIHNRGEVSAATREKIRRLLIQYNYTPDVIASSLALKKKITLGVVMPRIVNEHGFWNLPQEGVHRAIDELGQNNLVVESFYFDQNDSDDFIRLTEDFPYSLVQGVLFAPVFKEESVDFIRKCAGEQIPIVLFNSLLDEQTVRSYVGQDAFQSGYVAAKLINYGMEPRRDVAIVNMSSRKEHYAHIISREKGFRTFFEERSDRLDLLVTFDLNGVEEAHLNDRLEEAFRQYDIAGLFVTNSRVYKVAEFLALKGMMNVRLVGYDLLPKSVEYLRRDYIDFLISQKPEEQAFKGLTSLFNMVAFNREAKESQLMPIDIITRENLKYYQTQ